MIITQTIIRPNGTVEDIEVEVNDNYLDVPIIIDTKAELIAKVQSATNIASIKTVLLDMLNAT